MTSWHLNGFPDGDNIGSMALCRGEAHCYAVHSHVILSLFWCSHIVINVNVQYNGGFLPEIIYC